MLQCWSASGHNLIWRAGGLILRLLLESWWSRLERGVTVIFGGVVVSNRGLVVSIGGSFGGVTVSFGGSNEGLAVSFWRGGGLNWS